MDAAENQLTNKTGLIAANKQRVTYQTNTSFSTHVAQIICELHQSGCLIEQVELNRRTQQVSE